MSSPPTSRAAGVAIALAVMIGALIGTIKGQPSIGVLAGFAVGAGIALLLWIADRKRG